MILEAPSSLAPIATANPTAPNPQMATLDFFFQAEDGIRVGRVTGVQTCALPISVLGGDRPHVGLAPEDCGAQWNGHPRIEVATLALELRVGSETDAQIQIARLRAAGSAFTLARDPDARALVDAGRNADVHATSLAVVLNGEAPHGAVVRVLERQFDLVLDVAA